MDAMGCPFDFSFNFHRQMQVMATFEEDRAAGKQQQEGVVDVETREVQLEAKVRKSM
jgi:hypothetical protein